MSGSEMFGMMKATKWYVINNTFVQSNYDLLNSYIQPRNLYTHLFLCLQDIDVGDPAVVGESKVLQECANHCTLMLHECDGFYTTTKAETPENTTCHLVDNYHPQNGPSNFTIGHGEDTDKVYYTKRPIGAPQTIPKPEELVVPCDQDRSALTDDRCTEYTPTEKIKYYDCSNCTSCTYLKTVAEIISDVRCSDEDRILQCELEGNNVTSNINLNRDDTNRAFEKSWKFGQVRIS